MIYGIGVDIVEISRFKSVLEDIKLLDKLFTVKEQKLIGNNYVKAADNFAAKEAIVKITKKGFSNIRPKEIEILRDEFGAPVVNLYGNALEFFSDLNIIIHLSISNTKENSIAYAIGETI